MDLGNKVLMNGKRKWEGVGGTRAGWMIDGPSSEMVLDTATS